MFQGRVSLKACLSTKAARSYAEKYGAVYMNQFESEHNPDTYFHTLGPN